MRLVPGPHVDGVIAEQGHPGRPPDRDRRDHGGILVGQEDEHLRGEIVDVAIGCWRRHEPMLGRPGAELRPKDLKDPLLHVPRRAQASRPLAGDAADGDALMDGALLDGRGPFQKKLGPARTVRPGPHPGDGADLGGDQARGDGKVVGRRISQRLDDEIAPDDAGPLAAGHTPHGSAIGVAHPHPHHQIRRVTDGPGIAILIRGARLDSGRPVQAKDVVGAKGRRARLII